MLLFSVCEVYDQMDVMLENDFDVCGVEYIYLYLILFDNCLGGMVQLQIIFEDGIVELDQIFLIFLENMVFIYFFMVGEIEVIYILMDVVGNVFFCGFVVIVLDI